MEGCTSAKEGGEIYHHRHASSPQEDRAGEVLSVVVGDFGFQLDEAEALAKPVDGLDVDFAEDVGGAVEGVAWLLLEGEGVLEGGQPGLEGWEGEELVVG